MICISAEAVFELIIPLIMADIIDIGVKMATSHLFLSAVGLWWYVP